MISDAELNELRQGMAVVLQGTLPFTCGLFFSLNVYENVAFALRQRTVGRRRASNEATMTHLEMVGLRDRADVDARCSSRPGCASGWRSPGRWRSRPGS